MKRNLMLPVCSSLLATGIPTMACSSSGWAAHFTFPGLHPSTSLPLHPLVFFLLSCLASDGYWRNIGVFGDYDRTSCFRDRYTVYTVSPAGGPSIVRGFPVYVKLGAGVQIFPDCVLLCSVGDVVVHKTKYSMKRQMAMRAGSNPPATGHLLVVCNSLGYAAHCAFRVCVPPTASLSPTRVFACFRVGHLIVIIGTSSRSHPSHIYIETKPPAPETVTMSSSSSAGPSIVGCRPTSVKVLTNAGLPNDIAMRIEPIPCCTFYRDNCIHEV